jgi:hypothetical protein
MSLLKKDKYGLLFIALTIAWSWGVLTVPLLFGLDFEDGITKAAFGLAGAAPSVIALIFVFLLNDKIINVAF